MIYRILAVLVVFTVIFYTVLWLMAFTGFFNKERLKNIALYTCMGVISVACASLAFLTIAGIDSL